MEVEVNTNKLLTCVDAMDLLMNLKERYKKHVLAQDFRL